MTRLLFILLFCFILEELYGILRETIDWRRIKGLKYYEGVWVSQKYRVGVTGSKSIEHPSVTGGK